MLPPFVSLSLRKQAPTNGAYHVRTATQEFSRQLRDMFEPDTNPAKQRASNVLKGLMSTVHTLLHSDSQSNREDALTMLHEFWRRYTMYKMMETMREAQPSVHDKYLKMREIIALADDIDGVDLLQRIVRATDEEDDLVENSLTTRTAAAELLLEMCTDDVVFRWRVSDKLEDFAHCLLALASYEPDEGASEPHNYRTNNVAINLIRVLLQADGRYNKEANKPAARLYLSLPPDDPVLRGDHPMRSNAHILSRKSATTAFMDIWKRCIDGEGLYDAYSGPQAMFQEKYYLTDVLACIYYMSRFWSSQQIFVQMVTGQIIVLSAKALVHETDRAYGDAATWKDGYPAWYVCALLDELPKLFRDGTNSGYQQLRTQALQLQAALRAQLAEASSLPLHTELWELGTRNLQAFHHVSERAVDAIIALIDVLQDGVVRQRLVDDYFNTIVPVLVNGAMQGHDTRAIHKCATHVTRLLARLIDPAFYLDEGGRPQARLLAWHAELRSLGGLHFYVRRITELIEYNATNPPTPPVMNLIKEFATMVCHAAALPDGRSALYDDELIKGNDINVMKLMHASAPKVADVQTMRPWEPGIKADRFANLLRHGRAYEMVAEWYAVHVDPAGGTSPGGTVNMVRIERGGNLHDGWAWDVIAGDVLRNVDVAMDAALFRPEPSVHAALMFLQLVHDIIKDDADKAADYGFVRGEELPTFPKDLYEYLGGDLGALAKKYQALQRDDAEPLANADLQLIQTFERRREEFERRKRDYLREKRQYDARRQEFLERGQERWKPMDEDQMGDYRERMLYLEKMPVLKGIWTPVVHPLWGPEIQAKADHLVELLSKPVRGNPIFEYDTRHGGFGE
tara:strand:- start:4416 stop:6977 length:2562 start_codon:yes stop_codon:yes gene_type:complete